MPQIDSEYRGIGYMVTVLVEGAVDNMEPIFENLNEAEEFADLEIASCARECEKGITWEILINEVVVTEDAIEGSQYQTDSGSYAKSK